jgi:alcohol dehydrogenase (cytochrome c)
VWVADPGVKHQGNTSRTRGVALWEDLVIANIPDGRVIAVNRDTGEIVWDKMMAGTNEFGTREFFDTAPLTAEDKVLIANGAGDAGTRMGRGPGRANRQGAVAVVRDPQARRSRERDLEGQK